MSHVTHENAVVPSSALTRVDSEVDLASETEAEYDDGLSKQTARNVIRLAEKRVPDKLSDAPDLIVVLETWAVEDNDYPTIADERVMLVEHIEDYSEKSYLAEGAFLVDMDQMSSLDRVEMEDATVSTLVQQVDRTDTDFIDTVGDTYLPKSAVQGIYVYEA